MRSSRRLDAARPTAAILRARDDDTFWAARRVMAFSDEMIRALVKTGQDSDPQAEALLAKVLDPAAGDSGTRIDRRQSGGQCRAEESRAVQPANSSWGAPVSAYFRRAGGWKLVGLERMP